MFFAHPGIALAIAAAAVVCGAGAVTVQARTLTPAEIATATLNLSAGLERAADTSRRKPGHVDASAGFRALAETAATQVEALGRAVANEPDSDASRDAYASVLVTLQRLLEASRAVETDVTAAEARAWLAALQALAPTP